MGKAARKTSGSVHIIICEGGEVLAYGSYDFALADAISFARAKGMDVPDDPMVTVDGSILDVNRRRTGYRVVSRPVIRSG